MTHHLHHVRGRLRVRNPRLKNDPALAETVVSAVKRVPGVKSAEANVITGSLLLYYDPVQTQVAAVMAAIEPLLVPIETAAVDRPAPPEPRSRRVQEKLAQAVFWYALEKALERAAPLLLRAIL